MKKFYLLFIILVFAFGKSQFTDVYTFDNVNQPVEDVSMYQDHIFQGKYYYIKANGSANSYLYAIDPSTNSVTQVADVTSTSKLNSTASTTTAPYQYNSSTNYLYFVTSTGISGITVEFELWRTDGTGAGTVKLMSYKNGSTYPITLNNYFNTYLKSDLTLNDELIFVASPLLGNTTQLYKSDGTVSGTQSLMSVPSGGATSFMLLGKIGNNIIFSNTQNYLVQLWRTDGTVSGTSALQGTGGATELMNSNIGVMDGKYYYGKIVSYSPTTIQPFSTDGYTVQAETLPGNLIGASYRFENSNGLFWLEKISSSPIKQKLYYTTSNLSNAYQLADLSPGEEYRFISANDKGVWLNKRINNSDVGQVFIAKDGVQNSIGNPGKSVVNIIEFKNTLYSGHTLISDTSYLGSEIWRLDTQSFYLMKDIYPGTIIFGGNTYGNSSAPKTFFILNDKLYFIAQNANGTKLYSFNGDFTFNNSQNNNLWSANNNWNSNLSPLLTDNAVIPSGFTPVIDGTAFANNLDVTSPINLTSGSLNIGGNLNLGAKITLNNNSLNLKGTNSQITNGNSTNYIVTNGTGTVNVENLNAERGTVNLPIGTATNYNPVSIANTGTSDTFSARVSDGISNTTNGAVNATWDISEATAGGSNVNLTLGWNASQQNATFDSGTAKVGHYLNGSWTEENSGAVSNNFITATGISSFSPFAVMNFGTLAATDFSKSKVSVYPNPFNENLNISTENGGVVNFYDLSGKLVSSSVLMKGTNSLNKSSLAKGVYIYQIKNTNGEVVSSGKIIKK